MKKLYILILLLLTVLTVWGQGGAGKQRGVVGGVVVERASKRPVVGAVVQIVGDTMTRLTSADGRFLFESVPAGYKTLTVVADGFPAFTSESFEVTTSTPVSMDVQLEALKTSSVRVTASAPLRQTIEAPVSLRRIGREEIDLTPGANRDISKVVQSTPGVVTVTQNNRNDVLVRGGGANENKYFLDDIEIPVLNHFSVQGGSGGYASLVNTDLLRSVNFYTSAFPAGLTNGLSSVLDMKMKNGNSDRFHGKLVVGASDVGLTLDTPLSKDGKTTFVGSYRRSYLQFLFGILKLPFLPTYNDFQFKLSTKFGNDNEIYILGLGSFDNNKLNLGINDPPLSRQYILGYLPNNDQVSYVFGIGYRHGFDGGQLKAVLSRDYLRNDLYKYRDNDEELPKVLDISSRESNYRFRFTGEFWDLNGFRLTFGIGGGYGSYSSLSNQTLFTTETPITSARYSTVDLWRYEAFATLGRYFFDDKLSVLVGVRMDGMTYSAATANPLRQLSPRLSLGYKISEKWNLNATVARYYQEPTYTTLGYVSPESTKFNQRDDLTYVAVNQYVLGVKFAPNANSVIGVEGFFKQYDNLPVSLQDSLPISTGNLTDYIVGNVPARSIGKGRAYGVELSYRNLDLKNTVINFSYTLLYSQYNKMSGDLTPIRGEFWNSSWDVRHILNVSVIHKFRSHWTLGAKWALTGGVPFTPYDEDLSSRQEVWDVRRRPVTENALYNAGRTPIYHQLDVRVDKVWYFKKWRLGFYVDIQNLYNFKAEAQDILMPQIDANGQYVVDPNRPGHYLMQTVPNKLGGTILPTIGLTIEI